MERPRMQIRDKQNPQIILQQIPIPCEAMWWVNVMQYITVENLFCLPCLSAFHLIYQIITRISKQDNNRI